MFFTAPRFQSCLSVCLLSATYRAFEFWNSQLNLSQTSHQKVTAFVFHWKLWQRWGSQQGQFLYLQIWGWLCGRHRLMKELQEVATFQIDICHPDRRTNSELELHSLDGNDKHLDYCQRWLLHSLVCLIMTNPLYMSLNMKSSGHDTSDKVWVCLSQSYQQVDLHKYSYSQCRLQSRTKEQVSIKRIKRQV